MKDNAKEYFRYKILNGILSEYPFRHMYVESVFPEDFYKLLMNNIPHIDKGGVRGTYEIQLVSELESLDEQRQIFWKDFLGWLCDQRLADDILTKFGVKEKGHPHVRLVCDRKGYGLGPHRDKPSKYVTIVFYLAKDHSHSHLGTTICVPQDGFVPASTGHLAWDGFEKVVTMPYIPNSMIGFRRSECSFHSVETIKEDVERLSLLYCIRGDKVDGALYF